MTRGEAEAVTIAMNRRKHAWTVVSITLLLAGAAAIWAQHESIDDGTRVPPGLHAPAAVRLWDTVTPLHGQADVRRRSKWRPLGAGAQARLRGDLVMETDALAAAFASRLGKVLVYAPARPAETRAAVLPSGFRGKGAALASTKITAPKAGAATVQADFRAPGRKDLPVAFSFVGNRILTITAEGSTRGISLLAPIEVALVPSFVGDDLIYDLRDYPSAKTLFLPSEHLLLGLLGGESSMLVMTWQDDAPSVRLALGKSSPRSASIRALDVAGARSLSLGVLDAPGIWHREKLKPSFLERNTAIVWKPPFPALWLTQLYEDEVKTTYEFRDAKEETWRGGVGDYTYPAWFSRGKTMLSLGKKIPPEGEAIIYFLERSEGTPQQVLAPIDVVRRTLEGPALASVLEEGERPTRPVQRADAVIGGPTCHVTDVFKEVFDEGREVEKKEYIKSGVEDMLFYLDVMFERDARYYPFGQDMIKFLDAQGKRRPDLAPFIHEMRTITAEIVTTYDNARDTIRNMDYARELAQKTEALAAERRPDNPQRMVELKQDWTSMGGALEELARKENSLTRKLFQQAGYRTAVTPQALQLAEEIRGRAKKCLANPEDYEIWANY